MASCNTPVPGARAFLDELTMKLIFAPAASVHYSRWFKFKYVLQVANTGILQDAI